MMLFGYDGFYTKHLFVSLRNQKSKRSTCPPICFMWDNTEGTITLSVAPQCCLLLVRNKNHSVHQVNPVSLQNLFTHSSVHWFSSIYSYTYALSHTQGKCIYTSRKTLCYSYTPVLMKNHCAEKSVFNYKVSDAEWPRVCPCRNPDTVQSSHTHLLFFRESFHSELSGHCNFHHVQTKEGDEIISVANACSGLNQTFPAQLSLFFI